MKFLVDSSTNSTQFLVPPSVPDIEPIFTKLSNGGSKTRNTPLPFGVDISKLLWKICTFPNLNFLSLLIPQSVIVVVNPQISATFCPIKCHSCCEYYIPFQPSIITTFYPTMCPSCCEHYKPFLPSNFRHFLSHKVS